MLVRVNQTVNQLTQNSWVQDREEWEYASVQIPDAKGDVVSKCSSSQQINTLTNNSYRNTEHRSPRAGSRHYNPEG